MDTPYLDSDTEEETDGLKGTTSIHPAAESADGSSEEQIDDSSEEQIDDPMTPQWRRLTVTLSASNVDTLPEMTVSATHPTYSVSELAVSDAGSCTLWIPETVDILDFVLSFPATEQDNVSLTDIAVGEQNTITIPIVIITQ